MRFVQDRTCCLKVSMPPETLLPMPTTASRIYGHAGCCNMTLLAAKQRGCRNQCLAVLSLQTCTAVLRSACCVLRHVMQEEEEP